MFVVNEPIVNIDMENLKRNGIPQKELKKYLPRYILKPTPLYYSRIKNACFFVVRMFLTILVKVFLRPRKISGNLDTIEVKELYDKEARTYDRKHHLTTRGMDLIWRRDCGWFVSVVGRRKIENIRVLDVCTGTGLTIKEMIPILKEWGIEGEFYALDYNERMLDLAKKNINSAHSVISFVKEDAMNMENIASNYFDAVTQMFGIGGVEKPQKVFEEILRVLNPNGQLFLIDMHKPIPEYPGEWPFLLKWFRFPTLEAVVYEKTTIPLVLNRLWGWRDITLCFYFLPLITYQDTKGSCWGFETEYLKQESQRWWFVLPLMPIAKIIVKKTEISTEEARIRKIILKSCVEQPIG